MNIVTAVMTYGADVGGMLASLAALATLCLSLRRPRGKHRKGRHFSRPRPKVRTRTSPPASSTLNATNPRSSPRRLPGRLLAVPVVEAPHGIRRVGRFPRCLLGLPLFP